MQALYLLLLMGLASPLFADYSQSTMDIAKQGSAVDTQETVYISLVIDDLGYKKKLDSHALSLPGNISYAFLPFGPFSKQLVERAHQQNNEILLHLPMQAKNSDVKLGSAGLTDQMSAQQIYQSIEKSLAAIPYASGVNNHMGSHLTTRPLAMTWVMGALKKHQLFFLDSITTADSIAAIVAKSYQLPHTRRNVFLDHNRNPEEIAYQFERLIRYAKKHGSALGIGHPFPETLEFLAQNIPKLNAKGVKIIPVQQLINYQRAHP